MYFMIFKIYKKGIQFSLPLFMVLVLLSSCQNNTNNLSNSIEGERKDDARMTDFLGAMEYEFNMIKNPMTGTIPEGTYDAELKQAKDILAKQQSSGSASIVNPYVFQGPNNLGGRTRTIAYDVRYNGTSNRIILAGGVSGGVYKSTDDGASWVRKSPTGEHFSCTSIAQDPRVGFQDTWYYGVGEASGNSASGGAGAFYLGNGVYKSTDNGETWSRLASSNASALETFSVGEDAVQKVIVDPTNGNVYVACLSKIMRSTDAGATWGSVLEGTLANSGQTTDIVVTSTGRFYAGFGGSNSVGADGVWTSTTGASASWTRIAGPGGTPAGWNANATYGRVVLAIAPSSENIVYALYSITVGACTVEAELFRWDNTGSTWTNLSATLPNESSCLVGNDPFAVQGGYDLVVAVKPDALSTIFIGGTNAYRSTDAGLTWTRIGGYVSAASYGLYLNSHPDVHAFAFQPGTPATMLCGNDGGIQRTTANLAATVAWTQINSGYRTYQYYYVDIDPRLSNDKVIGGAQDNGSTRNVGGSGTSFEQVYGGDGVSVGLNDPAATGGTQYEYVGSQQGFINRRPSTFGLGFITAITPTGETNSGLFVTLFKLDQDNTQNLYYVNDNALYRTTSASTVASGTWTSMTGVAASVGAANDITALATTRGTYSALTASLFMGTSNGKVFRLDDPTGAVAAAVPVDITGSFPAGYISSIAVNPRHDDTVMVTLSNYGIVGNVWWTGNANAASPTWTNVEGTLTLPSFRSCAIYAVPNGEVQYYVGTSVGLYRSGAGFPGTPGWTQEDASVLGNAVITSLSLRPSDGNLLVGTHGYGMWKAFLSLFPVSVELTEFKGSLQHKNALLQWTTSAEYNSKHFELEKSFDGISFRKIATIPAAGYSNTIKNYNLIDKEKLMEKNYYRLRSIDINEKSRLSNMILIKPPGMLQDMIVLGNPFKNNINIRFVKTPETAGVLRLTDMAGRLMATQKFAIGEQQVQFKLPAGKLSRGNYQLQAEINNRRYIKQVIKE